MNRQEKFQAAMQKIADERDLDLVVDTEWSNRGWYSFQARASFDPVLRFRFDFTACSSSFAQGGRPGPLGRNDRGGIWSCVKDSEHDLLIARVVSLLDGAPETVRIVVLADGETYGPLEGSTIYEIPSSLDAEAIEEALAAGSLEGRRLR